MKPMRQVFTLLYTMNHFGEQSKEIVILDQLIENSTEEYKDIFNLLDDFEVSPSSQVVDNLVKYSKSSNH